MQICWEPSYRGLQARSDGRFRKRVLGYTSIILVYGPRPGRVMEVARYPPGPGCRMEEQSAVLGAKGISQQLSNLVSPHSALLCRKATSGWNADPIELSCRRGRARFVERPH